MAAHAKKSASGSKRWIKCPGSLSLVASMDPALLSPTGSAAMTGTCAHGLGEHCLSEGMRVVPAEYMGMTIWLDENEDATLDLYRLFEGTETRSEMSASLGKDVKFVATVDEKMTEGVQLYLDTVWADHEAMGATVEMAVEQRFDLTWLRPNMFGTSDCTLYQFLGLLRVVDYKNGYIDVGAEDNSQGLYYALGEAHRVEWMFDEVEVVIVQPNTQAGHSGTVKRWRVTKAQLEAFRDMLAAASDTCDEAEEALKLCEDQADFLDWAGTYLDVGDGDHCGFCDAFATCPVAQNKIQEIAMQDFAGDVPDDNELAVTDSQSLERLVMIIKWAKWLDNLVKAAKTLGQRRLEQGLEMPGYKLVEGKTNRVWTCTESETATLIASQLKVPIKELYEPPKPVKLKSPAQMEKISKAAKIIVQGVQDKETGEWTKAPLAAKPEGKLTMAPEADPRAAMSPTSAADDFVNDMPEDWSAD